MQTSLGTNLQLMSNVKLIFGEVHISQALDRTGRFPLCSIIMSWYHSNTVELACVFVEPRCMSGKAVKSVAPALISSTKTAMLCGLQLNLHYTATY